MFIANNTAGQQIEGMMTSEWVGIPDAMRAVTIAALPEWVGNINCLCVRVCNSDSNDVIPIF